MAFVVTDAINRTSRLWQALRALPKVELHRHLEGSIRIETLVELAIENNIPLPSYECETLRPYVQVTREDKAHHKQFLTKFSYLRQLFVSETVIRRVAQEAVEDAANDNIRYMELRFTPYAEAKLMNFPLHDVVDWVSDTVAETAASNDMTVNLIVAMNRHESVEIGWEMLQTAIEFAGRGVVGIDLCGNEVGYPAEPFAEIFEEGRRAGLGVTIHAGEWQGHENVRHAIERIGTKRIGHGVRSVEDSETLQSSIDNHVFFEVCPTSNLQTGVVTTLNHHPLIDLHYLNANVTINTDDPAIHDITLTDEYALVLQGLRLPPDFLKTSVRNAIKCAFISDAERSALLEEIEPAWEALEVVIDL